MLVEDLMVLRMGRGERGGGSEQGESKVKRWGWCTTNDTVCRKGVEQRGSRDGPRVQAGSSRWAGEQLGLEGRF